MGKLPNRMTFYSMHKTLIKIRISEIESFVRHSRQGMKMAWQEFSDKFDRTTSGWSDEEISEYVDHFYDDIAVLRDESPQLLRYAQCMIVYGTFEHGIATLCRTLYRDKKISQAPKAKLYMDGVKTYLRPYLAGYPLPFAKEWDWLNEFRIIRNWMAHNGGRVQKDSNPNGNWKMANTFIRRNHGLIKVVGVGEIFVEDKLIDRALEKAGSAIGRLHTAVDKLYK